MVLLGNHEHPPSPSLSGGRSQQGQEAETVTVVVGVSAPDGMILAAESRTTYIDGTRHRIASDFNQKVFSICDSIGVATYGQNGLGPRTIAGLMDEFVSQLPDEDGEPRRGDAIADALGTFFDERYRADTPAEQLQELEAAGLFPLGFLVAGYDQDGIGRIREVSIPGPVVGAAGPGGEITTAGGGAAWRGQTDVIRRLVFGFDGDLFAASGYELPDELLAPIGSLAYNILFPITMQDAVDFASFLIRTTIDMQRFSDGTHARPGDLPGCGGPIRVLAITRDGAQWIAPPTLTAATESGVAEGAATR